MVLTRPARPGSRRRLHSWEKSNDQNTHHYYTSDEDNLPREHQMDTMDSQEEPLLSEAFSCSTLLTECGGVIDSADPKCALLNAQVISKRATD